MLTIVSASSAAVKLETWVAVGVDSGVSVASGVLVAVIVGVAVGVFEGVGVGVSKGARPFTCRSPKLLSTWCASSRNEPFCGADALAFFVNIQAEGSDWLASQTFSR